LCWRCTAIYAGSLFFGILYTLGRDGKLGNLNMNWLTRPVSLAIMLLFGLPLILDGTSHALGLRTSIDYAQSSDFWLSWAPLSADWWLRVGTSLLATIGAVKFLCPRLDKMGGVYERLRAARMIQRPGTDATAQAVRRGRLPSG
jgi:nitric oxide reductase large subunit